MTTPVGPHDDAFVPVTILVPIDGSALGERSVPLAQQLAVRFDADVRTVTVGVDGHEVAADLVLDGGDPAGALLHHLADLDRTLVCMSSHGHGSVRRRLIGSVAEQLIRRAPTPVLVTGPQATRAEVGVPRTLLAGVAVSPRRSKLLQLLAAWHRCWREGRARPRPVGLGGRAVPDPHDRPVRARSSGSGPAGAPAARRRGAGHGARAPRQRPRGWVAEPRRPGDSTGSARGRLPSHRRTRPPRRGIPAHPRVTLARPRHDRHLTPDLGCRR